MAPGGLAGACLHVLMLIFQSLDDHPSVALPRDPLHTDCTSGLTPAGVRCCSSYFWLCLVRPQYEGGEPCSICGHVMLPPGTSPHESCMPATIISGFLYLGSYDTASRQDLLKAMGITHVLNVSTCRMLCHTAGNQQGQAAGGQHRCSSRSAQTRELQGSATRVHQARAAYAVGTD